MNEPRTQSERLEYLIEAFKRESFRYRELPMPGDEEGKRALLRSLMNVRAPGELEPQALRVQNEYLREAIREKGITSIKDLSPAEDGIYLWRGDITTLECDAIVNAANSGMTGCWVPCHNCIDNCIHTYAGVQLRQECAELMEAQGHEEPTGQAKLTRAYNLPCRYVIHTVGPIVNGRLTKKHEQQLASCYRSCLQTAEENGINSIAFCCISTGVFGFPQKRAAEIAVETVRECQAAAKSKIEVIFNVFKADDHKIYRNLLGKHR